MNNMTALKSFDTDNDINLYVAFHVTIDMSPKAADVKLSKTIHSIFDENEYGREFVSDRESGGEIIYRFQKPLLMSPEETKKFFENLKTLFVAAANLNPHFTQSVTGFDNKNIVKAEGTAK